MVRSYLRLDPFLPDHKADAQRGEDYPDGAGWTLVLTICWGAHQPKPGEFRNRDVLAGFLGKRRRWIDFLLDHGDLIEHPDGSLSIDGWEVWQEGKFATLDERNAAIRNRPKTAAERAREYRARKAARTGKPAPAEPSDDPPADPAEAVTRHVTRHAPERHASRVTSVDSDSLSLGRTVTVTGDGTSRVTRDVPPFPPDDVDDDQAALKADIPVAIFQLQQLAERLTGRPYVLANIWGGLGLRAADQVRQHGFDRVQAVWIQVATACGGQATLKQLVFGADDVLNPVPRLGNGKAVDEAAKEREVDELRRVAQLRLNGAATH